MNNLNKPNKRLDLMTVGFMVFASFFGAGNLIFPPYQGVIAGPQWWIGWLGFIIGDAVLAVLAIFASGKFPDVAMGAFYRPGKLFNVIMGAITMIAACPFLVFPRIGATAFEISIKPLLPNANSWIFGFIFFGVAFVCSVRPTRVVDIVGRFFTPILLIALLVLIVAGIVRGGGCGNHRCAPNGRRIS
jgi:LIVCS family branched-chain amino acid:cation transporter